MNQLRVNDRNTFDGTANKYETREQWLHALTVLLRGYFGQRGYDLPTNIRMAVGFTSTGAKGKRVGEAHSDRASADGKHEIFITPAIGDPLRVGDILVHELVHLAVGIDQKHGKVFRQCATAMGLTGKMRATVASPELVSVLKDMIDEIGPLPHGALSNGLSSGPKPQKNRQILIVCATCHYKCRASAAAIDRGVPKCPDPECPDFDEVMKVGACPETRHCRLSSIPRRRHGSE